MRINAFLARASGLSRRAADQAIADGRVQVNGRPATPGDQVSDVDKVTLDGEPVAASTQTITIMLNKPVGYVVSRHGQGSHTVYDLLPSEYHQLKPVGRLDKDSSGLLLLTNDGQLANRLTHPRYAKRKVYEVTLDKPLTPTDKNRFEQGVKLDDGSSKLQISNLSGHHCMVTLTEGRNRQIRRTFAVLGYTVTDLRRTRFGDYTLGDLRASNYTPCKFGV
ncbi:MAG TPA: pseudouridine synthase [Candidatus Saccharimonadales bacterium]|nr:pseudouridine synthase [Candidatus Saccharimonadales bacterium]